MELFDFMQRMKCSSLLPSKSVIKEFIWCLNLLDKNLRNLWLFLFTDYTHSVDSVNNNFKWEIYEDFKATLISSLTKSLFLSLKPKTVYSISLGECLIRNIVEGRLKFWIGNLECFLCLCLTFVIKLESSGDATWHH